MPKKPKSDIFFAVKMFCVDKTSLCLFENSIILRNNQNTIVGRDSNPTSGRGHVEDWRRVVGDLWADGLVGCGGQAPSTVTNDRCELIS